MNLDKQILEALTKDINQIEHKVLKYIYKKYKIPCATFNIFKNEIMHKHRPAYIGQMEMLSKELGDIENANRICEKDKTYVRTEYGYPDILRCEYILRRKNRFQRCANKIADDDANYCNLHTFAETDDATQTLYAEEYEKLIRKLTCTEQYETE